MINISRSPAFNPCHPASSLPSGNSSGAGGLLGIRPDAVMHLCAGDADSYDGVDGLVKNLLDDGGYNFNDGGMPLVGTVGEVGAYLTVDNKYMSIVTPSPEFISHIGRSNETGWIAFGFYTNDTSGGASLFTNQAVYNGGMYLKKQGNETSYVQVNTPSGVVSALANTPLMPLGVNLLLMYSWDGSNFYVWHARDGVVQVETLVLPTNTTLVADIKCNLFASYANGTKFSSGTDTRMRSVMMGSGVVSTNEQYAEIVAFAEAKDGVPYL